MRNMEVSGRSGERQEDRLLPDPTSPQPPEVTPCTWPHWQGQGPILAEKAGVHAWGFPELPPIILNDQA